MATFCVLKELFQEDIDQCVPQRIGREAWLEISKEISAIPMAPYYSRSLWLKPALGYGAVAVMILATTHTLYNRPPPAPHDPLSYTMLNPSGQGGEETPYPYRLAPESVPGGVPEQGIIPPEPESPPLVFPAGTDVPLSEILTRAGIFTTNLRVTGYEAIDFYREGEYVLEIYISENAGKRHEKIVVKIVSEENK